MPKTKHWYRIIFQATKILTSEKVNTISLKLPDFMDKIGISEYKGPVFHNNEDDRTVITMIGNITAINLLEVVNQLPDFIDSLGVTIYGSPIFVPNEKPIDTEE